MNSSLHPLCLIAEQQGKTAVSNLLNALVVCTVEGPEAAGLAPADQLENEIHCSSSAKFTPANLI